MFVSITGLGLLLLCMESGSGLLACFGVTLNAFKIAGGILRLGIGIGIVNGSGGAGSDVLPSPQAGQSDLMLA